MHLVERIVVNALHAMIDDGPSKDVTDVGQRIQHFDQIPRTSGFGIFLNFLGQEFDAKLDEFVWPKAGLIEFGNVKCLVELKQGGNDRVHGGCSLSRLKNLHHHKFEVRNACINQVPYRQFQPRSR